VRRCLGAILQWIKLGLEIEYSLFHLIGEELKWFSGALDRMRDEMYRPHQFGRAHESLWLSGQVRNIHLSGGLVMFTLNFSCSRLPDRKPCVAVAIFIKFIGHRSATLLRALQSYNAHAYGKVVTNPFVVLAR